MNLKVIGSGSTGNCYLLESEKECLVIEAGLPFLEVKKAIDFNVMKIVGVIISHEHLDHSKHIAEYLKAGFPVFSAFETQTALVIITGERTKAIESLKKCKIGNFAVTPFNVPHDTDIECYGYLIEHEDIGKMLFLTDLEYCPYNFKKQMVNHILVEANYCIDNVDKNLPNYEHVLRGHMELQTTLDFISTNDNPALKNVVLIHLSQSNSDKTLFEEKTKEITNADVYVARKGLQVNLDLVPF